MRSRYLSFFWRLMLPNAAVLVVACIILTVKPANGRVLILAAGLVVMLAANAVLIRQALAPLRRLTVMMDRIDPLRPGVRLPVSRWGSELTRVAEASNAMLDRLERERRDASLRALSEREGERRRLSAELHDHIGQTLTALGLHADRLANASPPELRSEVEELRDGLLASVEDVRVLVRDLRPEGLDALGLVPALTNLSERMTRRSGIEILRRLDRELPPIDADTELVIFRVAQESMSNALRHASPTTIELVLERADQRVVLAVRDDGVGLPAEGLTERGIRGMRERALSVGGDLQVGDRAAGHGTQVILEVPMSSWRQA